MLWAELWLDLLVKRIAVDVDAVDASAAAGVRHAGDRAIFASEITQLGLSLVELFKMMSWMGWSIEDLELKIHQFRLPRPSLIRWLRYLTTPSEPVKHRDLKPAKILMGANYSPENPDFGTARMLRARKDTVGCNSTSNWALVNGGSLAIHAPKSSRLLHRSCNIIYDTGATYHVMGNRSIFCDPVVQTDVCFTAANGKKMPATYARGGRIRSYREPIDADLNTTNESRMPTFMSGLGRNERFELHNVFYCPEMGTSLLVSGPELDRLGYDYELRIPKCKFTRLRSSRSWPLISRLKRSREDFAAQLSGIRCLTTLSESAACWYFSRYGDIFGRLKSMLPKSFSDMAQRLFSSAEPKSRHRGDIKWVVTSAAPQHMTRDANLLSEAITIPPDMYIKFYGASMKVHSCGDVLTDMVELHNVCVVPGLTKNLVSVSKLTELGCSIGFDRDLCCIRRVSDGTVIGKAHLSEDGDYILDSLKVPLSV